METLVQHRRPQITLAGTLVEPPPGAFLQASREGEQAITEAVIAGLPAKRPPRARLIDLYAGCGTISFALAAHGPVLAVEGDRGPSPPCAGLLRASRWKPEQRDLTRRPLMAAELAQAGVVVLDPPHAGAAEQVAQLVKSGVGRIIYVSCNPATLARDAQTLAPAYRIIQATPIDQFLWSARLEAVVVFERKSKH